MFFPCFHMELKLSPFTLPVPLTCWISLWSKVFEHVVLSGSKVVFSSHLLYCLLTTPSIVFTTGTHSLAPLDKSNPLFMGTQSNMVLFFIPILLSIDTSLHTLHGYESQSPPVRSKRQKSMKVYCFIQHYILSAYQCVHHIFH